MATHQDGDEDAPATTLLAAMQDGAADFTLTFRTLCDAAAGPSGDAAVRSLFRNGPAYDAWAERWRARLQSEPAAPMDRATAMRAINPAIIPRNHLVEAALAAATQQGDLQPFEALLAATATPYADRLPLDPYTLPPEVPDLTYQTFCGT